ncbi:MAG: hypothetical protein HC844_03840 [Tabrizicola sp.]|nr:hypothetical protein [Tabrizicola sp.]
MAGTEGVEGGGSLGLGLDPAAEEELIASIGVMFGMQMWMERREEDAEMFPEDGLA